MASPTTPQHGRIAALYRWRKNGFNGVGLNDGVWGAYTGDADSDYYEIEIDATGTPDTFRWRKNGGGWTAGVSITGASQTIDTGAQAITFDATTGHTVGDKWSIGNLYQEATTESTNEAQITDSTKRILNINNPPTFTDDGGETVLITDYCRGKAYFTGNVGTVTASGDNGYIELGTIQKVGYAFGWSFDATLDMADASRFQTKWKEAIPGQAGASGSAEAHMIGGQAFFKMAKDSADPELDDYYLIQLFNYDPDDDQTGDYFICWAVITGVSVAAPIGDIVKETMNFQVEGIPAFIPQA